MKNHMIIKIGSACLFDANKEINRALLKRKAAEIKEIEVKRGIKATLVVSGAIALGKRRFNDTRDNEELSSVELQRYACNGQIELLKIYQQAFRGLYDVSQLLPTSYEFRMKKHRENIKARILDDCENGIMTLVNYNDGVDFEQIRKDNDTLAARLLSYCGSERLIVLGKYGGFCDSQGNVVERVYKVTKSHYAMCNGRSEHGNGGFKSKLDAAKIVIRSGGEMIVGNVESSIEDLIEGSIVRTVFR